MSSVVILLIGDQPAPNLLPTRYLEPEATVFVHTERTYPIAMNLKSLLESKYICKLCKVDSYKIEEIQEELSKFLKSSFNNSHFIFNLTGGTKPMALATFQIARTLNSPFVYYQTEGNQSLLYYYFFDSGRIVLKDMKELPKTVSLDEYLRMYCGSYTTGEPRNDFEYQVKEVLSSASGIDEVLTSVRPQGLGALEVDFLVRCGNQIGVGEVKTRGNKDGIDQLNAVTEQRFLGTYVQKFLVSGYPVHPNNKDLAKAYRIEVIEINYMENKPLAFEDQHKLTSAILGKLKRGNL